MEANQKFKFVIVGSGNISNTYWNAVQNIEQAEIVGIVSRSNKKPGVVPDNVTLEVASKLSDLKSDFDAVILCTPNGTHHKDAVEAAKLGKHILTEKVLDISIDAMDEMINLCKKNDVKLGVVYQRRMSPDNKTLKNLIQKGNLGRIFAVDLRVKNYRDQAYYNSSEYRGTWAIDGGGPFMQQASHYIDLYVWFFGMPRKVISCLDTFNHSIEVEDHGAVILRHADGMIGTIIASTATKPGFDAVFEIHSEAGTVVLENDSITEWLIDNIEQPENSKNIKINSGASSASVSDTSGHEAVIEDFVESVKEDREPFISGESAKKATELILTIYNNTLESKCN